MSTSPHPALEAIHGRYARVLALGANGQRMTLSPGEAEHSRQEYARARFVSIPDILPSDQYGALVQAVLPLLSPLAERLSMRHERAKHGLSDGFRFARLDPELSGHPQLSEKLKEILQRLGLVEFAATLASQLTPLIRFVAGPVSFRRAYFYLYREGDYISVHDDHQVGARVDVQFPVSIGTRAGIRVLEDGFLRMRYDEPGSMNILGPAVWHDVPPILSSDAGTEPLRFNMGYRFMPDR